MKAIFSQYNSAVTLEIRRFAGKVPSVLQYQTSFVQQFGKRSGVSFNRIPYVREGDPAIKVGEDGIENV
jgi:hypothetical protein